MEKLKESGRRRYHKYYRVDKDDTAVKEISANNFKAVRSKPAGELGLQPGAEMFCLFTDIGQAMERAKAGAQAYIEQLIERGDDALPDLLRYRMDHYEDLNINLVDANIQKEESEMLADTNFEYKPYRISPEEDMNT